MAAPTTRVTLADVARTAGVSVQTVSNALNAPDRLKPDTRERVLTVVDSLGYRPNRSARSLRTARSRTIGLRVQRPLEHGTPFQDRFLHALADSARARDYLLVLFATHLDDEVRGYADMVRSGTVDSFVLTDTATGDRRPSTLSALSVPFVAFGRPWGATDDVDHPWVDVDGGAGTQEAVEHLLSRGRRRIALLGWPEESDSGEDRRRGWERGLLGAGVAPGPIMRCENNVDEAAQRTLALLDSGSDVDAIVCVSDTMAAGVYRAFAGRGIRAGEDVAVVGFDDGPIATLLPVPLTTVSQPVEQVADVVIDMLDALERGETPDPGHVLLSPTLTVRQST